MVDLLKGFVCVGADIPGGSTMLHYSWQMKGARTLLPSGSVQHLAPTDAAFGGAAELSPISRKDK